MEAAQTRAEIMLAHPYVSDIVGQAKTTIDFASILAERKIVLVKLSNRLSQETKKIIGTILVSELLNAIERRDSRRQFCIFIDEFQHFASYQDFPTLITQAPKYGIATTLAHHERYGQLAGNPEIMGATSAIANKILFQITARDAHELAPELAQEPEMETRYEEKHIVSREPVWDLLRWHDNPQIREFVNNYIRPLKERLEDIRGETEAERLIRMEELDAANLFRLEEKMETANPFRRAEALSSVGQSLISIGAQTRKLRSLSYEADSLRLTFRDLNKFLTGVMEGKVTPGQEAFGRFLMERIAGLSAIGEKEKQILTIYVALTYGDPSVDLVCPFSFAKKHMVCLANVLAEEVASWARESECIRKYREKRRKDMGEDLERLRDSVSSAEEYLAERKRRYYYKMEWVTDELYKDEEYRLREGYLRNDKQEKDDLEQNFEAKLEESVRNFRNAVGDSVLREIAPRDFTTRIDPAEKNKVMRACMQELGTAGQTALRIIDQFVSFCDLLSYPVNHIIKRSGQFEARRINARSEADMANEMVRNLTNLPKYTAYAKLLQDEGRSVWKGKMRTLALRAGNAREADQSESMYHTESRGKIQQEIAERHERLLRRIVRDSGPPPTSAPASQEPMSVGWRGDILTRGLFSRPRIVPEDEPPPSRS